MADKEQVIQALRATLISVKGALTLKQCNKDYRELQGEFIPYKKLGYSSLEKLFQDVPGFKIVQINGEWVVDAIASQETQHIASMVARQKSSKKPPAKLNYGNHFPKRQGSWRKPAPSNYYQTNYVDQYSKQFYRAKSQPLYNNNNNRFNNKYNKYNEHRVSSYTKAKPVVEQNEHNISKSSVNINTATEKEASIVSDDFKHSSKPEKQNEGKPIGKISASQRLSNLRDRLNTVDLIPLQLPAHNESVENQPVAKPPSFKLEPPPDLSSSAAKLEWTCQKLGLPQPVYKVHDLRPKQGTVTYHCSIKVGNEYFARSYPNPSPTEDLAKELAAVKILEEIIEKSTVGALKTSTSEEALTGLINLVSDHEAGVWAFDVPRLYTEKYQENLPENWMDLVEKCPNIIKEKVVNDNIVLLPNTLTALNPYSEKCRQDLTIDSDLPPLQFPDHDFWNVFITVANSTLEIWLRIIGPEYSDAFEVLLADMAQYYNQFGTCVDKSMILVNAWYAVKLEEGGWQRAKILEIKDEKATVFLGDHGDDDIVSINKIKILEPQFRKLPAQAILCRLEGAEELAESEAGSALVRRRLPGEVLVAAPGPRHDPSDPSIAVVLYDTSTHRDLNLNKEIVHDFCMSGAFTLTQKPCEVEVGCVSEEGRVWVVRAGGAAAVRAALTLLTTGPYRRPLPAAPKAPPPAARALYIVRTLLGDWVRCTIISGLDGEGTVRTQLVDSGLILRAPLSSLVPLQAFSPALNEYPFQALQVRLGGVEQAAGAMVARLRELLLDARVLCRTLPAPSPAPAGTPPAPAVELYVRTGPQQMLASVNNDIQLQYEERQQGKPMELEKEAEVVSNTVEALNKKKERIFRSTSTPGEERAERPVGGLPPPPLPAPGQSLDVFVAMAANPWNFVVQPNSTRHLFHAMMAALQVECPKIPESEAPTTPASGELYTAYYDKDSSWYRVVIAGVVSTQMVSVYFCDYGDLTLLSVRALRPAPAAVPDARALPPQAIKARLYNVCPLYKDWSVEDCIRFQELCVEQQFVGVCREVGRDQLNPLEPLLTLELIDTSTEEDIYLNAQLVKERRARLDTTA